MTFVATSLLVGKLSYCFEVVVASCFNKILLVRYCWCY